MKTLHVDVEEYLKNLQLGYNESAGMVCRTAELWRDQPHIQAMLRSLAAEIEEQGKKIIGGIRGQLEREGR